MRPRSRSDRDLWDGAFSLCAAGHRHRTDDGKTLYVASQAGAILVFDRNPTTGVIAQKADDAGCIADANPQCSRRPIADLPVQHRDQPGRPQPLLGLLHRGRRHGDEHRRRRNAQPDDGRRDRLRLHRQRCQRGLRGRPSLGRSVLRHRLSGQHLRVRRRLRRRFRRRPPARRSHWSRSGRSRASGLRRPRGDSKLRDVAELGSVRYMTSNAAGTRLYVATESSRVVVLTPCRDGRIARLAGTTGCLSGSSASPGARPFVGLGTGNGIALSPQGEHAYVAGGSGLVEYAVAPTAG